MKITNEHFKLMQTAMAETLARYPDARETYADMGLSPKRLRWDVLRSSTINGVKGITWLCDNLYPYLNDAHIDTALRHIMGDSK